MEAVVLTGPCGAYLKDDSINSAVFHALVMYFHPDWLSEKLLNG